MAIDGSKVAMDLELEGFDELSRALNPRVFMPNLRKFVRAENVKLSIVGKDTLRRAVKGSSGWAVANAALTVALKGSSKPLIDKGDLWGNINKTLVGSFEFIVGTKLVDHSGKHNLAWIIHEGTTIDVDEKVRKFFRAKSFETKGRIKPLKASTIRIVIPGRKYMEKAFIKDKKFTTLMLLGWRNAIDKAFRFGSKKAAGGGKKGGKPGYKFKAGGAGGGGKWVPV